MLQLNHRAYKLLITGKSGSGKSTYFLRTLLGLPARCRFILDHKGEVAMRLGARPCLTVQDLAAAVPSGWVVFNPSVLFQGRRPDGFAFFCDFVWEICGSMPGTKIFAVDELQQFLGTQTLPPELAAVLEDGRIRGLDAVLISSQPNIIHNRIRNQITEVAAFKTEEKNALDWLESRGFEPGQVAGLARGQFICRNESGAESRGQVF